MIHCKYYKLEELIHPSILEYLKYRGIDGWILLDPNLLKAIDVIREKYGVTTCIQKNNKDLWNCGFRSFNHNRDNTYSAHKFGKAFDLHIKSIEDKCYNVIKNDYLDNINKLHDKTINSFDKDDIQSKINSLLASLKEMKIVEYNKIRKELLNIKEIEYVNFEDNVSWLHTDTLNRPKRLFNP